METFNKKEQVVLRKTNTPIKVQDLLNTLKFNFEEKGETKKSPLRVLRTGSAHCLEGAILAAYILSLHGYPALLLHLKSNKKDFDHVIALFQKGEFWGAISKTNHAVLRYREPVYKSIRELALSYFHEYFLNNGEKTLRAYSEPLDLSVFEKGWEIEKEDLWGIDEELDKIRHFPIAPKKTLKNMRLADQIEIRAGKLKES